MTTPRKKLANNETEKRRKKERKSYSKEEIDRILTRTAAHFSLEPKADYIEVSLKCLKRFLPEILPVISEIIREPLLAPNEIELSRTQMIAELKNEQDHPDSILQLLTHKAFYKNHLYSKRPYLETVPAISRDDLVKLIPQIFNKQNTFFILIGDLNADEAKSLLERYFGNLPEGPQAPVTFAPPGE